MRLTAAFVLTGAVATGFLARPLTADQSQPKAPAQQMTTADAEAHLAGWKAKPREAATTMMKKYGPPQEMTARRLIWHDAGPWAYTEIVNEEIPHDFPVPHVDFWYQAIPYKVNPADADELLTYDGSVILERTKGMIAARCDKEEPNFLAINLAHDIVTKKRSVEDARKFYAESMMSLMKSGTPNNYQSGFTFQVPTGPQGDRDTPAKTSSR